MGTVYKITPGELEGWRQIIIAAYPDAGVPDWTPSTNFGQHPLEDIQAQLRMMQHKALERWLKGAPEED